MPRLYSIGNMEPLGAMKSYKKNDTLQLAIYHYVKCLK